MKQLIKSLLLSFIVGLGIINFSSADNTFQTFYLNTETEINDTKGNYFKLLPNGNFLLNNTYKYFSFYNGNFLYNYFWFDDGIYFTLIRPGTSGTSIVQYGNRDWQGYIPFCEIDINEVGSDYYPYCFYSYNNYVYDFYTNSRYSNPSKLETIQHGNDYQLCFYYDDIPGYKYCNGLSYSICYSQGGCLSGSLQFTNSPSDPSELSQMNINSYVQDSTWSNLNGGNSSGSNTPNQSIFDYMGVQPVYNTLYKEGYRQQMCYGGFSIDDLFGTGNTSFSNIQAGTGAFVFDLYSLYSGGSSFVDWYDNNYLDYLYLESFQDQYEYDKYFGKSKGLVGLGIVRNAYFGSGRDNFDTSKYKLFCEYVRDYSGMLDTHDNTPMGIIDNTLSEELINSIVGDINILIPNSGTSLDVMVQSLVEQGYLSGDFSSCMSGDSYASCFDDASYWEAIKSAYDTFNISFVPEDTPGILPSYIIIGFFSILLLYYLRR